MPKTYSILLEVGVKAFLYEKPGEFLMLKRANPYHNQKICKPGKIKIDPKEHSEYKWINIEDLKKYKMDSFLSPIIKTLLSNKSLWGL